MTNDNEKLTLEYRPLTAEPHFSALERQALRQALVILVVALFLGLGVMALQPDRSMLAAAVPLHQVVSAED